MLASLPRRAPLLIAVGYLLLSLPGLRSHGVTYDAPALFYGGDRTLFFLTHRGVPGALDFRSRPEPPGFHSFFSRDDEWADPMRYPVLPALVAAAVSAVVHDGLGWLDPAAAHHLGLLLLNAAALAAFAHYAMRFLGFRPGLFAAIALAVFPSAFGHAFNNPKDWPSAMWYGVAILAAGDGAMRGRARTVALAGVFIGLSLAAKLNGVFALATLVLWVPALWWFKLRRTPPTDQYRLAAAFLLVPYLAGAVFVASWPWIWNASAAGAIERMSGYLSFMAAFGVSPRDSWTAHPLRCLLFMTPPAVLLAVAVAAVASLRSRDTELKLRLSLLWVWLLLPVARSVVPHSNFYDANRHFIEYVPALCALAGWGFARALEVVQELLPRLGGRFRLRPSGPAVSLGLRGAALLSLLVPLLRYAPFETSYFNFLVGGLGGAQARGLFHMPPPSDPRSDGTEGDYWYQSLRVAMIQAARAVPTPATIGLCRAPVVLARANLTGQALRPVDLFTPEGQAAPIVWVSPREGGCGWAKVRELETERQVLLRVERDGGLIYELLGPKGSERREPVSRANRYTGGA